MVVDNDGGGAGVRVSVIKRWSDAVEVEVNRYVWVLVRSGFYSFDKFDFHNVLQFLFWFDYLVGKSF